MVTEITIESMCEKVGRYADLFVSKYADLRKSASTLADKELRATT